MKKFLSIIITVLMLMQMFTFAVSSEEASMYVRWTEEGPGEIEFTTISGVQEYEIKLYKNEKLIVETSHSIDGYDITTVKTWFLDEITQNGTGTYRAEVLYADGVVVSTDKYYYKAPTETLATTDYLEFNQEKSYVVWNAVEGAKLYDLVFCFSADGGQSFWPVCSYILDAAEDGTFFEFFGNPEDELKWIEESYQQAIIDHETTAENFIRAIQVVAYPAELNNANPSYSDYVTFDGITIPDDGDDNTGDGSYSYMEIYDCQYEYYQGQEFYADLKLVYVSDDGTETYTIISSKECEIEGFDSYTPGYQTVTLRYGDISVTCDVYVKETDEITPEYSVSLENVKTEYEYGEAFYAEVWVTDIDGNRWQTKDYEVEGFDSTIPGWQTVTVRYDICSEVFKVYVAEKEDDGNTSEFVENVYWSGEMPGQVNFTMIDGVDRYRIKLYRNDVLITESTHSFGSNWWQDEGYHAFLEEICTNGSGTYRAEVAPDDGNGYYTASEDYVYKKPTITLEKPQNVVLDRDAHCITWDEVPGVSYYNVCFGYSIDGGESFFMLSSTQVLPEYEGCYYDMQYDIKWLEEDYIRTAENNGIAIDELIRVMQIVAFPTDLNDANISYSDYVTFEAITAPDDDEEEPSDAVTFENVKTKYEYGEEFYAEAWITDANGEYYQAEGWRVEGYDPYMSGWQTVTLWYGDYCEYYKVYVAEKENTDTTGYIKIVDYQREYYPGMEFYANLLVWEETDDGSMASYSVDINDCIVEGFDSSMPGEQVVTIWYNDYCVECYVTVYPEEPEPVYTVEFENVKTEYEYGEEFYIEVYRYINGEKIAFGNDEWWVEGFDSTIAGWQEVTVFCENRVETYEVYVNAKEDTDSIAEVYWTGERPAEIYFTFVPDVMTYSIKVLKDDEEVHSIIRDFKRYDRDEGGKVSLRDVVLGNGSGIYTVGVAPVFDGFMDTGKYTVSGKLIYREPEDILPCVGGITYNLDSNEIFWDPIEEAVEYDVIFCYSPDGGENFYPVTSYTADEEGYFNFYGDADYEIQWLKEEYASYAEAEGLAVEDLIKAIQIKAFPLNLNDAAPSYSDYVIIGEDEPENEISEVEIRRLKKQYYEGEEIDAEIWYETIDGRHEFTEDFTVKGYDAYFIGEQNITISYGGYSEDFTVIVKEKPIIDENVTHIRIVDYEKLYYLGDEFVADVYAYTEDGDCYRVEEYLYYDFDSAKTGSQVVTVRYGDFTTSCYVNVFENELTEALSGTCGENLTWILDTNGVLTISGTGAMTDYEYTDGMPWYDNRGRIKEIIIEEGVTSIGKNAFAWCYSLTNVEIPDSITEIADYAFYACEGLEHIFIPDGTVIGSFAFSSCERLLNITFDENVTIGEWAFSSCKSLVEVSIPATITMGDCVFRYCESLENIYVDDSNPYYCSIDGNLFNKDRTTLIQYAIGKRDTHYEIPYGVTTIGEAAFDICENLTSINIPSTVTLIDEFAFRGCSNLTDVYYDGTEAQWSAITVNEYNDELVNATIHFNENPEPSYSVTFENVKTEYNIGEEFYIEVYEYTAEGQKIELSGWTVEGFDSTIAGEQTVTVKYGDYSETFVVYVNEAEENTWWEYDAANLELIIKGEMGSYGYDLNAGVSEAPWDYLCNEVEIISIWDGVTNISDGAFINFTNLRDVNLGGTVNRIGASAFEGCRNLTYIAIPDSVEYIGPRAFRVSGLETVKFGENVRTIATAAFMGSMLTRVELPESLGIISSSVFASCKYLNEIYIPLSVHSIQPMAFNYCTGLTDVYFGGTQEEWNNIARTNGNDPLYNANIYFDVEELTKTISIENIKYEYEYGEEFYAEVWVETSDGNRWQTYDFEVIGFDPYTTGWQTVTLRYDYYEESFEVFVSEKEEEPYIVSVDFELLKDTYYRGEELKVYVYENMSDGTCNRVYDFEIVNFDSTQLGQQMITINYKGFGKQFVIMVESRPASGGGGGGSTAAGPVITVSEAKCRVGNTVDVEVSISENTGFMNLGLEIEYDSALKLVGVTEHNTGATFTGAQSLDVYPYNFNFSSTGDVAYNGTLVTLTFEIPEDTQAGDYFVDVDFYKGRDGNYIDGENVNYDANENPLNLRYEDGFINVYNYIPGDINGNGIVDNKDGTALLRYLAGWTMTDIDFNALDVDGNGTVDNKDGTRLLRYLAGWDVEVH